MLLVHWLGAFEKRLRDGSLQRRRRFRRARRRRQPVSAACQAAEALEDQTLLSVPVAANDLFVVNVDTSLWVIGV